MADECLDRCFFCQLPSFHLSNIDEYLLCVCEESPLICTYCCLMKNQCFCPECGIKFTKEILTEKGSYLKSKEVAEKSKLTEALSTSRIYSNQQRYQLPYQQQIVQSSQPLPQLCQNLAFSGHLEFQSPPNKSVSERPVNSAYNYSSSANSTNETDSEQQLPFSSCYQSSQSQSERRSHSQSDKQSTNSIYNSGHVQDERNWIGQAISYHFDVDARNQMHNPAQNVNCNQQTLNPQLLQQQLHHQQQYPKQLHQIPSQQESPMLIRQSPQPFQQNNQGLLYHNQNQVYQHCNYQNLIPYQPKNSINTQQQLQYLPTNQANQAQQYLSNQSNITSKQTQNNQINCLSGELQTSETVYNNCDEEESRLISQMQQLSLQQGSGQPLENEQNNSGFGYLQNISMKQPFETHKHMQQKQTMVQLSSESNSLQHQQRSISPQFGKTSSMFNNIRPTRSASQGGQHTNAIQQTNSQFKNQIDQDQEFLNSRMLASQFKDVQKNIKAVALNQSSASVCQTSQFVTPPAHPSEQQVIYSQTISYPQSAQVEFHSQNNSKLAKFPSQQSQISQFNRNLNQSNQLIQSDHFSNRLTNNHNQHKNQQAEGDFSNQQVNFPLQEFHQHLNQPQFQQHQISQQSSNRYVTMSQSQQFPLSHSIQLGLYPHQQTVNINELQNQHTQINQQSEQNMYNQKQQLSQNFPVPNQVQSLQNNYQFCNQQMQQQQSTFKYSSHVNRVENSQMMEEM